MPHIMDPNDGWDGSGGGGNGPGGGGPSTYADAVVPETGTLQILLGEGRMEGLVNGLKSVYLDNTPLQNSDNTFNFKGVALALVAGTNTQAALKGITGTESETAVNVQVTYATPVTRSVTSNPSAVRVRISIPALKVISTTDGNSTGNSLQVKIEIQNATYNSGAWTQVALDQSGVITGGPFSTKFTKAFRIDLPATGTWQIRVTRLSADDADAYHLSQTWWDAITEIVDVRLRYPNSAVLSLRVNAKQFRQIPQVNLLMKLTQVQIPANYNPLTRAYATTGTGTSGGAWDGTFTTAWTDNPAWCFYDAATKTRYGAGTFLAAAGIDKWTLYSIAQWCDTLVTDGKGGTEPRMVCNLYLQGQQNAIKALGQLASIFWGVVYYASGLVVPVPDSDAAPAALFTNANVEEGKFTYEGTARQARHTAAIVTFQNPDLGYDKDAAVYEDEVGIARFGYNVLDMQGIGCTSQGQAMRLAKWAVFSELMASETVGFSSGLEGSTVKPGDVIQISDQFRAGAARFGGRILAATTTVITLDAPVTLGAGTYTLRVQTANGMESKTVTTGAGATSTLTVGSAFSAAPIVGAGWLLQAGTTASLYRVLSVRKGDGIKFDITALLHDPAKYTALGLTTGDVITRPSSTVTTPAPAGLAMSSVSRILNDRQQLTLNATWTLDGAVGYIAQTSRDYGPWEDMTVSGPAAYLDGIQPGSWRVRVAGDWRVGGLSPYSQVAATITASGTVPPWVAAAQSDATTALANAAIANSTAVTAAQNAPLNVTGLPTLPNATYPANKLVYDNTTKRLYRSTGSAWEASTTDAGDLTGTLNAARVAVGSLDSKITTITNTQLGTGIDITKLTGTLDAARVAVGSLDSKISVVDAAKLTTGTLDVARIATNALDQSKIASIPTSKLTGTVGADLIAANAVYAKNMVISNFDNLVPNPTSEMASPLAGSYEAAGVYGSNAFEGTNCRRNAVPNMDLNVTGLIPVQVGETYYFSCKACAGSSGRAYPIITGFNAAGGYVGNVISWETYSTTYVQLGNSFTIPAGMSFIQVDLYNWGTGISYFDNLYLRKMTDSSLIVDGAITTQKMTAGTINADRLSADSITSVQIAANAITASELAANAVTAGKILAGTIVAADIAASTITGAKIAGTTITAANLAADTITANEIAANAITSNELAANAVIAGKIAAGTIVANDIAASTITGAKIAANTITAGNIAADTITAGQIAAGAIGASEIAANSVFASKLVVGGMGTRLNLDPTFQDPSFWTVNSGAWAPVPDSSAPVGGTSAVTNISAEITSKDAIPIDYRKKYRLTGWLDRDTGANGTCYLGVQLLDSAGANINGNGTYFYLGAINTAPPANTWTRYTGTLGPGCDLTIPTNAKTARLIALLNYGGTVGQVYLSGLTLEEQITGELIVDGAITANKLEADLATVNIIRSSNWNGSSSVQSTTGYKVSGTGFVAKAADGSTATVQADFASATMMGGYLVGGLTARAMSAIGDNGSTSTSFRCFYRGSNDPGTNGGRPNIARLTVTPTLHQTASPYTGRLDLKISPSSYTDNLDGLSYAKIELFSQSVVGTTATLTTRGVYKCRLPDRLYYAPTSDSDANNASEVTQILAEAALSGVPACKVTLYGVAGSSDTHCFYAGSSWSIGSALTDNGTSWPSGITGSTGGGSGGGSGGGGYCPAPDVPLLMADGSEKPAGDICVGDLVVAWDEEAGREVIERVTHAEPGENERWWLTLSNGRAGRFARNHRFLIDSGDWCELQNLTTGEFLSTGVQVVGVEPEQTGPVIKITVNRVHTYLTLGAVSHNAKPMIPT